MISLQTYNKIQLQELIISDEFRQFPFCPISVHRAQSHISNPAAGDEDTLLILAFYQQNLAGYIGILPDMIKKGKQKIKTGWLSTIFVHPDYRGKKIAQKLLHKACDEYQGHIIITEFTPEAGNMYMKSNLFIPKESLNGRAYYFLSDLQKILPVKNKKWETLLPALKILDGGINAYMKIMHRSHNHNLQKFEIAKSLDEESATFISTNQTHNSFNRNTAEIRWITNYPWVTNQQSSEPANYQFSAFDKKFEYVFIKIYTGTMLNTVLMLSVRNHIAKLHFVFGNKDAGVSAQVLNLYIRQEKISILISFDEEINKHLDKLHTLYKKGRQRHFLMHKNLDKALGNDFDFNVAAGDGDAIFT